jgi:hypothetical protein
MEYRILLDILKYLEGRNMEARLSELHLTRFFTTVELDDGSVGACASYYKLADHVLDVLEHRLRGECLNPFVVQDVELLQTIVGECVPDEQQRNCLVASLMCTVASALTAPVIRRGGDEWFEVEQRRPMNWIDGAETALVVGFGGYLEPLIAEDKIKTVHVIDLVYDRKPEFGVKVSEWSARYPSKTITASTHLEGTDQLSGFDLISITASTLCNGTLEYFLANVREDAIVILQGQSGSLHPKVLFEAGVKWVATTLKPGILGRMSRGGHDGDEMRSMLQGGLPWIYLLRRRMTQ